MPSKPAIEDARRTINGGNETSLGLTRLPTFRCEATTPVKTYRPQVGTCPYQAKFTTRDGQTLCQLHAELWAAKF